MATTKKKTTSKQTPRAIMKEIERKRKAGASSAELNKLADKYMKSLTYNSSPKKRK